MKTKIIILLSLFVLFLISCDTDTTNYEKDFKLLEKETLKGAFILNSSSNFKGYFYLGTMDNTHYFSEKWNLKKDKKFKIKAKDFQITKTRTLFSEPLEITLLERGKRFGNNRHYQLYIFEKK